MLHYLTNFTVAGLENAEKVKRLQDTLTGTKGVTKVVITPPQTVSVTYNPAIVKLSGLKSILSPFGLKNQGG